MDQDEAQRHFPLDDITDPFTPCELHIPQGNITVMVATAVVTPIDHTKTPRIHTVSIPAGYAKVSIDRVVKEYWNHPLDIEGGDGEKTLGQVEKAFICWRKRYIIIPGASPPPQPIPRCGWKCTTPFFTNYVHIELNYMCGRVCHISHYFFSQDDQP